jgi:hypothetical protein
MLQYRQQAKNCRKKARANHNTNRYREDSKMKKGLDYFSMPCMADERLELIEAELGL